MTEKTIPVFSGHSIYHRKLITSLLPSAVQLQLQHKSTTLTQECVECKTISKPFGTRIVIRTPLVNRRGSQPITSYNVWLIMALKSFLLFPKSSSRWRQTQFLLEHETMKPSWTSTSPGWLTKIPSYFVLMTTWKHTNTHNVTPGWLCLFRPR